MPNDFLSWAKAEFLQIETNPSYTPDEKVTRIIRVTAAVCGGAAMQPIPVADIFVLTPIQVYMGYKIGRVRGIDITEDDASTVFRHIAGAVGMGVVAQQTALALYKLGLPFLGGLMTFPLVASLTVGIGRAMDAYFLLRAQGKSVTTEALRQAYQHGKTEGRQISPEAVSRRPPETKTLLTSALLEAGADTKHLDVPLAESRELKKPAAQQQAPLPSSEDKDQFNHENPELAEVTRAFFQDRHFLDVSATDQEVLRQLAAKEKEAETPEAVPQPPLGQGTRRLDLDAKLLRDLWGIRYPTLSFEPQPLRWAAGLSHMDLVCLERVLNQLYGARNPVTLSRSKIQATGEHHLGWRMFDGTDCRLFYSVKATTAVTLVCKKSEMGRFR